MTDVGETLQYAAVIDYFSFVKRTRPRWNCPSSGFNSIWFSSVRFRMAVFRACHVYSSYILLHVLETIARSGLVALCVGVFSTNRGRNSLIPWPKRGREMRNGLLQFCHGNIDASENPVKQHWEYAPQGRIYPLVFCVRVCLQNFPDAVSNVVGFALLF